MPYPSLLLALPLLLLFACTSAGSGDEEPSDDPVLLDPIEIENALGPGVSPEFEPALRTVVQALEDGNEAVARSTLNRLIARGPEGDTLEFARALERILDGRQLARELDLSLEATESLAVGGRWHVTLVARQETDEMIVLHSGGAQLRQLLLIVDPDGREQRAIRREPVPWPDELIVAPGEELRLALVDLQLPAPPGLLALSSRLVLEIVPGELIDPDGRYLPAQELPVEPLEIVRLASFLPTAAVEPVELARYVQSGRIFVPALMERAVRILPESRGTALDLLVPHVQSMSLVELELLVPALRWLSRTTRPGGDPEAWRQWMRDRGQRVAGDLDEPEELDLPGR